VCPTDLFYPTPTPHFETSEVFLIFFEVSKFQHFISLFLKFKSNLLVKIFFFFLPNAAFAVTILDFISHAHLVSLLSGYPDRLSPYPEWLDHDSCRQPQTYVKPETEITVFELLMLSGVSLEIC
jgi:hypothetical protein